jgi:glutathione reductase (NADPH)
VKSIFAVGDVTNRVNLTPVAIAEGRILVEMLFNKGDGVVDHTNVPSAVFSQPPVATVGLSETTARAHLGEIDVYSFGADGVIGGEGKNAEIGSWQ